ncbi:MAG: hypothetical protein ACO1N0_02790 [Fluviicola sp.]
MKTLVFTVSLLTLSTLSSSYSTIHPLLKEQQGQRLFRGYVFHQGSSREITLTAVQTQYGWKCVRYDMRDPITTVYNNGQMYGDGERFIALNPNSQLATTYNFTHSVSTPQGTAYLNMN